MFDMLINSASKYEIWLVPVFMAGTPLIGAIFALLFKKFPGLKKYFEIFCKAICGEKKCDHDKKTRKAKTLKK